MITTDDYVDFIIEFFGTAPEQIQHVIRNWNPIMHQTTCGCYFKLDTGIVLCDEYIAMEYHRRKQETSEYEVLAEEI